MTSPSAVHPIATSASDSDEYEYEEVEIEEEIEVEEEVTDDEYEEERKPTIVSNDEKSSKSGGGIMTAEITNPINECSKQVTAFDKVLYSEEQTTQVDTKDVCDARQKESWGTHFSMKDSSTDVGAIKNNSQKSDEGVSEGTRSDMSISAETIITSSSEIEPTLQKEVPATNFSSNDVDKVNPPVKADSSLHGPLSNPFMGIPNIHGSDQVSSYATKMEESAGKGNHSGLHNHDYNPSYHSSVSPRTKTSLSSSPWKSNSKFSSYDWEPSKPFRSAFLISQGISTPDIQFDPVLTSTKPPPKIGDKLSKLSSSSRVPPISGTHSSVKEKLKTEYSSDKFSIGSHVNDNNGINVGSNEVADTKQETTKSASKGKEHVGDVVQASEVHVSSHHSLRQNDGGPTKEVNNIKLEFDAEGDMHRESKPLRHFRAALIEFVKELMKPTWLDGKLSKDAHKLIVKKAVDKVLTTLPPDQVPSVKESIDMYLTSSRTKLMKLVEAYIAKYGKI
ncbi:hypothetical protein M8C21_007226 [Ambrosia artemisiifolia]|uniref:Uncharacterized protein n=1 Tax=Ambrosia artemisiifolia TaxID=4212 RepID=A0AAD5BYE5_AMBAR|nr:hypothetical protein M8C21_007226 [Ambrosia artemisiifolia]